MNKYDYTGKDVFVGIDVHKKTYSCVSLCDNKVIKRDTMPAKPEVLVNYLKNNCSSARSINTAYEAGFSGFYLHRFLLANGINNMVVHPGSIEVAARDRVKTDKRDAFKIATQLAAGRLRCIFIPSQEREEKRTITRLRTNLVKARHRVGQEFKALLFTQGLIDAADDTVVCLIWLLHQLNAVAAGRFSDDFYYSLEQYSQQWVQLNERIKKVETRLAIQAKTDNGSQLVYESTPGIGAIHARQLVNELEDMRQFKNEKQLFSYLGLTPSEHSSGEHTRQGHITRQGKSQLRKIFIEAAWIAIYKDPSLYTIFERLAKSRGKKRAIVAIARRLAGRIRACLLTGSLYHIKETQEAGTLLNMVT